MRDYEITSKSLEIIYTARAGIRRRELQGPFCLPAAHPNFRTFAGRRLDRASHPFSWIAHHFSCLNWGTSLLVPSSTSVTYVKKHLLKSTERLDEFCLSEEPLSLSFGCTVKLLWLAQSRHLFIRSLKITRNELYHGEEGMGTFALNSAGSNRRKRGKRKACTLLISSLQLGTCLREVDYDLRMYEGSNFWQKQGKEQWHFTKHGDEPIWKAPYEPEDFKQ